MSPTPSLHGNHDACPACEMRQAVVDHGDILRPMLAYNVCDGTGHIALSAVEIVRRTCVEAQRVFWPAFDRRISA